MRFQFASLLVAGMLMAVSAVPELEHDLTEIDRSDCKVFSKKSCLRECPKGYAAFSKALCSSGEDQHECCAVLCCRSRHTDDDDADSDDFENSQSPSPQAASGNRFVARSRSGPRWQ